MRVLVVEDEVALAEAIGRGLTAEGFTVEVTHDGLDGGKETVHGWREEPIAQFEAKSAKHCGKQEKLNALDHGH